MPSIRVSLSHALDPAEAMRRLRQRYDSVKAAYQAHVSDLEEAWDHDSVSCRFRALGQQFQGTLKAEPGEVRIDMEVPLMAMIFRGTIESRVREELGKLLA